MKKTGEAYTTARLHLLKSKKDPSPTDYAARAGMSDTSVTRRTGRSWAEWVRTLDAARAAEKSHREIAEFVSSLGAGDWWSQMVTVGYERIRGLRDRGQRRGGGYSTSKSRTLGVPVETLFDAFADAPTRGRWLPVKITVRTATPHKSMRITWDDGTRAQLGFTSKGSAKSAVAVQHERLPDRAAAETMKHAWSEYLERLSRLLS
jgi:uncharacterized protein YndB with AHSA1/START domain